MSLNSPRLTKVLVALLLLSGVAFASPWFRLPGHNAGYQPTQPINYSHKLHAGDLGINCQYCHFIAERSPHAGYPAVQTCLNCHKFVKGTKAPEEIKKIYKYAGLDEDGNEFEPGQGVEAPKASPIPWVKIHILPAFVRFDHSRHVNQNVSCQTCHGPIQKMEKVAQYETLSMGMCINCHRNPKGRDANVKLDKATLDCSACHH